MTNDIRIYVADSAAYNAGRLHGKWIDATLDVDGIHDQINDILRSSPEPDAEEFAIHDYEGFGQGGVSEYEGIESVHAKAVFIEEHGDLGVELISHFCGDLEDASKAPENYCGEYRSLEDYAEEQTASTTEIPEHLVCYIDYDAMARDIEMNGEVFTIQTAFDEVHIFWCH